MRLRVRNAREIPGLAASYHGRRLLLDEATLRLWPVAAPLVEAYRRVALARVPVVAVVGSQGKSSTVRAIQAALGVRPHRWSEYNAGLEVALNVARHRPSHRAAVIEVGIGARGQMSAYSRALRPDRVVVTSIGTEHAGSLGTREEIRAEKARMALGVPPSGAVFLNADDEHVLWMRERTRARCVTFGFSEGADVRATDLVARWPDGTRFTVSAGGEVRAARSRFVSRDLVRAHLAAVAVALDLGEPLAVVLSRLSELPPTPRRLEPVRLASGAWLLRDEYKSSLETIESALDVVEGLAVSGRRFVVLGEVSEPPGSQGPIYRALGERIARCAHAAVFVGANFQRYAAGARRGGLPADRIIDAGRSWEAAATYLREALREGDVVLVKGRDTQRLDRVSLSLMGRVVRCRRTECELTGCDACPLLGDPGQLARAHAESTDGTSSGD